MDWRWRVTFSKFPWCMGFNIFTNECWPLLIACLKPFQLLTTIMKGVSRGIKWGYKSELWFPWDSDNSPNPKGQGCLNQSCPLRKSVLSISYVIFINDVSLIFVKDRRSSMIIIYKLVLLLHQFNDQLFPSDLICFKTNIREWLKTKF